MSDALTLDLFIQDFVNTNILLGQHISWQQLVNRRFTDDGVIKVFQFQSGGVSQYALGQRLHLPDGDWFRIELTHQIPAVVEHRFDCLRLVHPATHNQMLVEAEAPTVLIKLLTRHRGLINIVFVIRDGERIQNPFMV